MMEEMIDRVGAGVVEVIRSPLAPCGGYRAGPKRLETTVVLLRRVESWGRGT